MGGGITYSIKTILLLVLICLTFLSGKSLYAQDILIQGRVIDTISSPIPRVNVLIHPTNSKSIIAYTTTNNQGVYEIKMKERKEFDVSFTGLSYKAKRIHISAKDDLEIFDKDIVMNYKEELLEEVIIQTESNIRVKKDTIIIKASAFRDGNEEVLEDLLSNIPGLEVDANGNIQAGNRGIEKIMVEGDDFFGRGYKLLSKNMDHQGIENIEIYRHYSENKLLKDVENSDKVALNITLKEDYKAKWFGNVTGGYDALLDNRHVGKINLMSFGKKNKFYFLSAFNNLGLDDSGDLDDLINSTKQESIANNDDLSTHNYFSDQEQLQYLGAQRTKFNNSKLVSLNSILNLTNNLKVKLLAFTNLDRIDFFKNSAQAYRLNQIEFINNEEKESVKNITNFLGKVEVTYDFSQNATLNFFSTTSSKDSKTDASLLFNDDSFNTSIVNDEYRINQNLNYTQKFKDSLVLEIRGRYTNESSPQSYTTNSQISGDFLEANEEDTISQTIENELQFYGFQANLFKRFDNQDLFELKTGFSSSKHHLSSVLLGVSSSMQNNFVNDFNYKNKFLFVNPQYSKAFKELTLSGSLSLRKYLNELGSSLESNAQNNLLVLNPIIGLSWEKNNHKISTQYSYKNSPISLPDVNPNFILKDFRSFERGLGFPEFLGESSAILNYTSGNWGDRFFAKVFANYTKRDDYISTNSSITANTEEIEKSIFKDQNIFNINGSVDQFINPINSNIKLKGGLSQVNFENIVNQNLNRVEAQNVNYGFEYKSAFLSNFNFHLGSEWFYSDVSSAQDFTFSRNISFVDFNFNLLKKINFSLRSEVYLFEDDFNSSDPFYFIDFDLRYTIKKNKLSVQLHGENMLNTKQFTDYFVTDVVNTQTTYRIIPRYVLLKFNYRF